MRSLLLVTCLLASIAVTLAAPGICPSLPVNLELRSAGVQPNTYKLVFTTLGGADAQPDYIDIHYRINNMDGVNLRALSQMSISDNNLRAKQAQVEGIVLRPGDALRAYATYNAHGYSCDTPIHTFNAPEVDRREMDIDYMNPNNQNINNQEYINNNYYANQNNYANNQRTATPFNVQRQMEQQRLIEQQRIRAAQRMSMTGAGVGLRGNNVVPTTTTTSGRFGRYTPIDSITGSALNVNQFWTQAALEEAEAQIKNEVALRSLTSSEAACPTIDSAEQVFRQAGTRNTYVLGFENKNPSQQLHYVDLHVSNEEHGGWDNLRLASDMQLTLAHKVLQPGVVMIPGEPLRWYWSYRAMGQDGRIHDCTTPIRSTTAEQVSQEVNVEQIRQMAA